MKGIYDIARGVSAVFSPLLMGTYGTAIAMFLSFLCYSSLKAKLTVIGVTMAATCAAPVIFIFLLTSYGVVKDPSLNTREERTWPYLFTAVCYLGTAVYLHTVHAPLWLSMFMMGGMLALIVVTAVNRRWKISGHATGMGGLVAVLLFLTCSGTSPYNMEWYFLAGVVLAGVVSTCRLILDRHTLMQVAAGFANGFLCLFLPAWYTYGLDFPAF